MKNMIMIMTILLLSLTAFGQTVPTKKMAFIAKKTATWCNPCGTWAWATFNDVYNRTGGEPFIATEMHTSSSSVLSSSDASTMYNYMEQKLQTPVFYANSINETQYATSGGIYTGATKTRLFFVADSIGQIDADINAAYTATITPAGVINVTTKTEVFNDVTGDYYLGIYLIEKNVVAYQSGIGSAAVHKSIFRDAISSNVMGDLVASGTTTAGTITTNSITHTVDPSYDHNNLQLFAVLWKKVGNNYHYESAYSDFQTLVATPINRIELNNELAVKAYTNNDQLFYQLDHIISTEPVTVDLIGANGQVIKNIYNGNITNNIEVTLSIADLPKGIYFVRTILNEKIKTIKVLKD